MSKTNFLVTLEIFLEDDFKNFSLEDLLSFLAENSVNFDKLFKGMSAFILKNKSNKDKIRENIIANIPKVVISSREALDLLEVKKGLNHDKIEELKLIIQVMMMTDTYLKSNRFK